MPVTEEQIQAAIARKQQGPSSPAIQTAQQKTQLSPNEETAFRKDFARVSQELGLNTNPDDPLHFFDYRGLFREKGTLEAGPNKHFPSKFKFLGHPNLIVDGKDTRTGNIATQELINQNEQINKAAQPQQGVTDADIQAAIARKQDQIRLQGGDNLGTSFISANIPLQPGQQVPIGRQRTEDLLNQIGTKLPSATPIRPPSPTTGSFAGTGAQQAGRGAESERLRNLRIVQELKFRGFSEKEIEERLSPTFREQLKSDIGRTAGGIGGGIGGAKAGVVAGFAIGGPPGAVIGGLGGAAIGAGLFGFVGEDIQNTVEMVNIARKANAGERLTFNERKLINRTEEELKAERRGAAIGEGFSELVGRVGIGALAKATRRPFASAILPEVRELQGTFAKVGGQFSPAQLVEGSAAKSKLGAFFADFVDTLESVAENGFGGRGIFKRFRQNKQVLPYAKLIKSTADDIVKTTIRMTPEQKAVMLADVLNNRKTVYKGMRNSLYRWARKANKGDDILVSIEPLERFLNNTRRRVTGKLGRTEVGEGLIKKLDDIIAQVKARGKVRDVGTGKFVSGKQMTILEVEDMLVGLNSELGALARAGDTPGKRIATVAKSIMTREAKKAEKGLTPEVFRRLGVAKKFVREGQPIFEEQVIKTLLDGEKGLLKNPEILNKIVFPNAKPSQIQRVKDLVIGTSKLNRKANERKWNNLAVGWLEDAIEGSKNAEGFFSPTRLKSQMDRLGGKIGGKGNKSLDVMFGPATSKKIQDSIKIGSILTSQTEGGGGLAIRLGQIGAVGGVVRGTGGVRATAAAILMLPSELALLMTSETGIKALTAGLKAKPGSAAAAAAAVRIASLLKRSRKEKQKTAEARQRPTLKQQRGFRGRGF